MTQFHWTKTPQAAALWAGGLLYEMAEELGPKFGHSQDGGMTYLNRKIVDRLVKARDIISNTTNTCSAADVHDLRIIVRETISYMTAVLIQSLVDSMITGERSLEWSFHQFVFLINSSFSFRVWYRRGRTASSRTDGLCHTSTHQNLWARSSVWDSSSRLDHKQIQYRHACQYNGHSSESLQLSRFDMWWRRKPHSGQHVPWMRCKS